MENPWWMQKEREVGERLRTARELTKADLMQIVEWKFKTVEGRLNRVMRYAETNDDLVIRRVSKTVFEFDTKYDEYKLDLLCAFRGVKVAVASAILTFYDPQNYGVFDTHVWRELFGSSPTFTKQDCLKLFKKLRILSEEHAIPPRTIEKALFQKNKEEAGVVVLTTRRRSGEKKQSSSKFHLQEIDWVIYFPSRGNEGRPYPRYGVAYRDRKRGLGQRGVRVNLGEILSKSEVQAKYPHTVGYFLESSGRGTNWVPQYLVIRKVHNPNEFFLLLGELSL
jgi:hypothetical protein